MLVADYCNIGVILFVFVQLQYFIDFSQKNAVQSFYECIAEVLCFILSFSICHTVDDNQIILMLVESFFSSHSGFNGELLAIF